MPTLPGLPPSCLDLLPLCLPCSHPHPSRVPASECAYVLGSVSDVVHVSISICPSESAFQSWSLSLTLSHRFCLYLSISISVHSVSLHLMNSAIFFILVSCLLSLCLFPSLGH